MPASVRVTSMQKLRQGRGGGGEGPSAGERRARHDGCGRSKAAGAGAGALHRRYPTSQRASLTGRWSGPRRRPGWTPQQPPACRTAWRRQSSASRRPCRRVPRPRRAPGRRRQRPPRLHGMGGRQARRSAWRPSQLACQGMHVPASSPAASRQLFHTPLGAHPPTCQEGLHLVLEPRNLGVLGQRGGVVAGEEGADLREAQLVLQRRDRGGQRAEGRGRGSSVCRRRGRRRGRLLAGRSRPGSKAEQQTGRHHCQ